MGRGLWFTYTIRNLLLPLKGLCLCTNHSLVMNIRHACRHQLGSLAWFIVTLPKSSVDFCQKLPGSLVSIRSNDPISFLSLFVFVCVHVCVHSTLVTNASAQPSIICSNGMIEHTAALSKLGHLLFVTCRIHLQCLSFVPPLPPLPSTPGPPASQPHNQPTHSHTPYLHQLPDMESLAFWRRPGTAYWLSHERVKNRTTDILGMACDPQ